MGYALSVGLLLAAPLVSADGRRPIGSADEALTRAAECLDRGDEIGALPHLRMYVNVHPEALMVRAHLAELLFRAGKPDEARGQFERFIADAQRASGQANAHRV